MSKRKLEFITESIDSKQSAEIKENEHKDDDEGDKSPPKLIRSSSNAFNFYGKNNDAHAKHMLGVLAEHNLKMRESKLEKKASSSSTKTKSRPSFQNLNNNNWTLTKPATKKARKEVPQVPVFNSLPIITLK